MACCCLHRPRQGTPSYRATQQQPHCCQVIASAPHKPHACHPLCVAYRVPPRPQVKSAVEELLQQEALGSQSSSEPSSTAAPSNSSALSSGRTSSSAFVPFNTCLLNLYEDGARYVGWHRDNEREFGEDPEVGAAACKGQRHGPEQGQSPRCASQHACHKPSLGDAFAHPHLTPLRAHPSDRVGLLWRCARLPAAGGQQHGAARCCEAQCRRCPGDARHASAPLAPLRAQARQGRLAPCVPHVQTHRARTGQQLRAAQ